MAAVVGSLDMMNIGRRDEKREPKMKKATFGLRSWVVEYIRIMQALSHCGESLDEYADESLDNGLVTLSEEELESRRVHAIDRILYEMKFQK